MSGSRRQVLDCYLRIGIGLVLICAVFVRAGLACPLRISSSRTVIQANHVPLKPRLLDPRSFDSIQTDVFSALHSPTPLLLIAHSAEPVQIFRSIGPCYTRPPPRG